MDKSHHRIVFKGEIFPGYERIDVIQNIKTLCGYDDATLEKLFSGQLCIIKDNIKLHLAQKYKIALEGAGIICQIQEVQNNT